MDSQPETSRHEAVAAQLAWPGKGCCVTPQGAVLRDTERRRLRSLVEPDLAAADVLHAED
jgi:hypothetical protein